MFLDKLLTPRPQVAAGRALFRAAIEAARDPSLYVELRAPDTPEGRFELLTAHVVLVLRRLAGDAPAVAETRQAVFDALVRNLDDGLREMGVGDLSVGKKMRRLAEAVYGRLRAYNDALADAAPADALQALVERTVLAGAEGADGAGIAQRLRTLEAALAAEPDAELLEGRLAWADITP